MSTQESSQDGHESPFPLTRWSIVARASDPQDAGSQSAWSTLCNDYWFPLYAYARRSGNSPQDAEDITQAFFVAFIRRASLSKADPEQGRLRSYLMSSFKNFMISEHRKEVAEKRGGSQGTLSLDLPEAEARLAEEPYDGTTPEQEFDRRWALQLIEDTLSRLEMEHVERGKEEQFEAFRPFVSCNDERVSYEDLSGTLGMTKGSLRIAIFRVRQRFAQLMREAIADTVLSSEDVDGELAYLFEVFQ